MGVSWRKEHNANEATKLHTLRNYCHTPRRNCVWSQGRGWTSYKKYLNKRVWKCGMEWQNPIVSWWVWHRYPSHPSSDNDHVKFQDMLISMEVCYSIFNIQTYHVGMNYGKLESRMAWKYLWYSDENDHYWYQSRRNECFWNPLMKSLATLVVSCYMFLFSRSFVMRSW